MKNFSPAALSTFIQLENMSLSVGTLVHNQPQIILICTKSSSNRLLDL